MAPPHIVPIQRSQVMNPEFFEDMTRNQDMTNDFPELFHPASEAGNLVSDFSQPVVGLLQGPRRTNPG